MSAMGIIEPDAANTAEKLSLWCYKFIMSKSTSFLSARNVLSKSTRTGVQFPVWTWRFNAVNVNEQSACDSMKHVRGLSK